MPDDVESAVAAWLDQVSVQREIQIAKKRLARMGGNPDHAVWLALGIEILAALNIYELTTIEEVVDDDTEPPEPWRK